MAQRLSGSYRWTAIPEYAGGLGDSLLNQFVSSLDDSVDCGKPSDGLDLGVVESVCTKGQDHGQDGDGQESLGDTPDWMTWILHGGTYIGG